MKDLFSKFENYKIQAQLAALRQPNNDDNNQPPTGPRPLHAQPPLPAPLFPFHLYHIHKHSLHQD